MVADQKRHRLIKEAKMKKDEAIKFPSKVGEKKTVYEDPYQKIHLFDVDFETQKKKYYVLDRGKQVGLVLIKDNSILLVQQYRFAVNQVTWEVPCGSADPEDPNTEAAAMRECLEETGYEPAWLKLLLYYEPGVDTIFHPSHIYWSDEFTQKDLDPELVCEWVDLEQATKMIYSGKIIGSMTVISILSYLQKFKSQ